MIFGLGKKRFLSLALFFIASLFYAGILWAEPLSKNSTNVGGVMEGSVRAPLDCRLGYRFVYATLGIHSVFGSQKNFEALLTSSNKKLIHEGPCSGCGLKNLLSMERYLLKIDMANFSFSFLYKSVENGAIFLFAASVVYSLLFRGEREVKK